MTSHNWMRPKLFLALFVGGLAVAGLVLYAQDAQDGDRAQKVISLSVTNVVAPTTATDKDGNYVHDLKPSQFTLYDNDKPQTIKVDESFAPISLVVAIQANAKVEPVIPKLQKLGALLKSLVAGDQGEVAILSFDHRLQVLHDFTSDTTKLQDGLKNLKPGSSSSQLIDAVERSSQM